MIMEVVYALLIFGVGYLAWLYGNRWYKRPSGMPEVLLVSYSYQTLRRIASYVKQQGTDPETTSVSKTVLVVPYLKDLRLSWRQRNDVIGHIFAMDWVYRDPARDDWFTLAEAGTLELESAGALRLAVGNTAKELPHRRLTKEQAKTEMAAVTAGALRVDASTAPSGTREPAEAAARDIEDAVRKQDPEAIDRKLARAVSILQIANYALPYARDVAKAIGLLVGS
jgi:hypothetical protein